MDKPLKEIRPGNLYNQDTLKSWHIHIQHLICTICAYCVFI